MLHRHAWAASIGLHAILFCILTRVAMPPESQAFDAMSSVVPATVPATEQMIPLRSVSAAELATLNKNTSTANTRYIDALEEKIAATESATAALAELIRLTEQSMPSPTAKPPAKITEDIPSPTAEPVRMAQHESFPGMINEPTEAELTLVQAQEQPQAPLEELVISVDPLLVYRYNVIKHIKAHLPGTVNAPSRCDVTLSLSPQGELLRADFMSTVPQECEAVRQAVRRAGRLPGSQDPNVIPYLSEMVLRIDHG